MYEIQGKTGIWHVVIGLEVHAKVTTISKLFSPASATFVQEANEHVDLLDASLPGTLPVVNSFSIEQAVRTGIALNGDINHCTAFARKNYFYPDLPQGYQISQDKEPIIRNGYLEIMVQNDPKDDTSLISKKIRIDNIHLEQDAGKNIHATDFSLVDLNRSGVSLMEIVSYPDISSAQEAVLYVNKLRNLLRAIGTCDGNMEKGSLRADVNISVKRVGDTELGTRTEVKNLNSIRSIHRVIEYEAKRQVEKIERGEKIIQQTMLYNIEQNVTKSLRIKENANDYRYFPDPDLLSINISDEFIDRCAKSLPELPDAKFNRFVNKYGLSRYDAQVLVSDINSANFFEKALSKRKISAKLLSNWITVELFSKLHKQNLDITRSPITEDSISMLVELIENGTISGKIAKDVFEEMFLSKRSPNIIISEKNLVQISDNEQIEKIIEGIIVKNPNQVKTFQHNPKIVGWFVAQVMAETKGKANPAMTSKLIIKLLKNKE